MNHPMPGSSVKHESIDITVDRENAGDDFWDHVHRCGENAPAELVRLTRFGVDTVTVSEDRYREVRRWCELAPGWYSGSRYAPHPLLFVENYTTKENP